VLMTIRKLPLEILLLSSIANLEARDLRLTCSKSTISLLKKYSATQKTIPPLLTSKNNRYFFVGVPIFRNKSISDGIIRLEYFDKIILEEVING
jgi:hypothetical protein